MHYHLEIIMPPTDKIDEKIEEILEPFKEGTNNYGFWDWWQLGGRWNNIKLTHGLNLKEFYEELSKQKITVSSVVFGKEGLRPESQIELVDKIWQEFFPDHPSKVCPLFDHYKSDGCEVTLLKNTPLDLKCERVIIAAKCTFDEKIEAKFMIAKSIWNGTNSMPVNWKGTLEHAIEMHNEHINGYKPEYIEEVTPASDWLCVTVDYHN